ncbi:MAG: FixH family protein [Magnetococcus sp. THC-1_WYH]
MNHNHVENTENTKKFHLNPWLTGLVLFFVCVFIANGVMIILGMETFNGVTTANHYEKGLAFNETLQQRQKQKKLGLSVDMPNPGLISGVTGLVRMTLRDRTGQPITGVIVHGSLYRNVQEGTDQPVVMQEREPGLYEAQVKPPLPGHWELRLALDSAMGPVFYNLPLEVMDNPKGA